MEKTLPDWFGFDDVLDWFIDAGLRGVVEPHWTYMTTPERNHIQRSVVAWVLGRSRAKGRLVAQYIVNHWCLSLWRRDECLRMYNELCPGTVWDNTFMQAIKDLHSLLKGKLS